MEAHRQKLEEQGVASPGSESAGNAAWQRALREKAKLLSHHGPMH